MYTILESSVSLAHCFIAGLSAAHTRLAGFRPTSLSSLHLPLSPVTKLLLVCVSLLLSPLPTHADHPGTLIEKNGNVAAVLHLPEAGVFAGEDTPIRLRFYRLPPVPTVAGNKPVTAPEKPTPITATGVRCEVSMPSMADMPKINTVVVGKTSEDYATTINFPHGGVYAISLRFAVRGTPKPLMVRYFLTVDDENESGGTGGQPLRMTLKTSPDSVTAMETTRLFLQVHSRATGNPVTRFETVHEKKMHLIVVSQDLSYFYHVHPELKPDGTFVLPFAFPKTGDYQLFAEVAPLDTGVRPLRVPVRVSRGVTIAESSQGKSANLASASIYAPTVSAPNATTEGLTVSLKSPIPTARTSAALTFVLTDANGKPVTGVPFWLGAPAHLVAIHEDVATFVHSHPITRTTEDTTAGRITFLARFPKAGTYRCWVQVRQQDHILTFPIALLIPPKEKT